MSLQHAQYPNHRSRGISPVFFGDRQERVGHTQSVSWVVPTPTRLRRRWPFRSAGRFRAEIRRRIPRVRSPRAVRSQAAFEPTICRPMHPNRLYLPASHILGVIHGDVGGQHQGGQGRAMLRPHRDADRCTDIDAIPGKFERLAQRVQDVLCNPARRCFVTDRGKQDGELIARKPPRRSSPVPRRSIVPFRCERWCGCGSRPCPAIGRRAHGRTYRSPS